MSVIATLQFATARGGDPAALCHGIRLGFATAREAELAASRLEAAGVAVPLRAWREDVPGPAAGRLARRRRAAEMSRTIGAGLPPLRAVLLRYQDCQAELIVVARRSFLDGPGLRRLGGLLLGYGRPGHRRADRRRRGRAAGQQGRPGPGATADGARVGTRRPARGRPGRDRAAARGSGGTARRHGDLAGGAGRRHGPLRPGGAGHGRPRDHRGAHADRARLRRCPGHPGRPGRGHQGRPGGRAGCRAGTGLARGGSAVRARRRARAGVRPVPGPGLPAHHLRHHWHRRGEPALPVPPGVL